MRNINSGTAANISAKIKNSPIITTATQVTNLEWNFNNCFRAQGVNNFASSEDVYSYANDGEESKTIFAQNKKDAESFGLPWRETSGMSDVILTNKGAASNVPSGATALSNSPSVASYLSSNEGFRYWTTPLPTRVATDPNVFKSGGRDIAIVTPTNTNSVSLPKVLGVVSDSANNKVYLIIDSPLSISLTKVTPSENIKVSLWSDPSRSLSLIKGTEYTVASTGKKYFPDFAWGTTSPKDKTIRFGSYTRGIFTNGLRLTSYFNHWGQSNQLNDTIISGSAIEYTDTSYWVDVYVNDYAPNDILASRAILKTEFNYIELSGVTPATIAINKPNPVGASAITGVSGSGSAVTYTLGTAHNLSVGDTITTTGISPAGYNLEAKVITSKTSNSVTVASTATGSYVSGGVLNISLPQLTGLPSPVAIGGSVSSTSINVILNSLASQGGGTLFLSSPSTVTLNDPIILPSNTTLNLTGSTINSGATFNANFEYAVYMSIPRLNIGAVTGTKGTDTVTIAGSVPTGISSRLTSGTILNLESFTTNSTGGGNSITYTSKTQYLLAIKTYNPSTKVIQFAENLPFDVTSTDAHIINSQQPVGNQALIGGTWNLTANGKDLGLVNAERTYNSAVVNLTATGSATSTKPLIRLAGARNFKVAVATLNGNECLRLTNSSIRNEFDSCINIEVSSTGFTGRTCINTQINAGSEISTHRNIKILGSTFNVQGGYTPDALIKLDNASHTYIAGNTFGVSATAFAISITATLARVEGTTIGGNTFNTSKSISLYGKTSNTGVTATKIYSNVGMTGTITTSNIGHTIYYNNGATTLAGSIGQTENVVTGANPATLYYTTKQEVSYYSKAGNKIYLGLAKKQDDFKIGSYVLIHGVHPDIDGIRKVLSNNGDLIVSSSISSIVSKVYCDPANEIGFVNALTPYRANKITVKFDTSHGSPVKGIIQCLIDGSWSTVYNFTGSDLSTSPESDVTISDNIKTLTLYRHTDTTWTTTAVQSEFTLANAVSIYGVRAVIVGANTSDDFISIAEISGRMVLDVSEDIKSISIDKELDSGDKIAPIGFSSSNTGSLTLANEFEKYTQSNFNSPLSGMLVKNVLCHTYFYYGSDKVKAGTMVGDSWNDSARESATMNLTDKSIIFQNTQARDVFVYESQPDIGSYAQAPKIDTFGGVKSILNATGFGNIKTYGKPDTMRVVFSNKDDSAWSVIQDICKAYQMAAYFNEYGTLELMSRDYLYPEKLDYEIYTVSSTLASIVGGNASTSELKPGMVGAKSETYNPTTIPVKSISYDNITTSGLTSTGYNKFTFRSQDRFPSYHLNGPSDVRRPISRGAFSITSGANVYLFSIDKNIPASSVSTLGINEESYDTDACYALTKSADMFVEAYSRTSNTVTLKVRKSLKNSKNPVQNDRISVSGLGTGFDIVDTGITNSPTLSGDLWTVQYSLAGSVVAENTDAAGVVAYSRPAVGYYFSNLSINSQYTITGKIYTTKTITISSNATITGSATLASAAYWQEFSVTFTANASSHYITYSPVGLQTDDKFYVFDDEINLESSVYTDTNGYDEIFKVSEDMLETASKISVKFTALNPYSEKSTTINGLSEVGRNQQLWKMDDTFLLAFRIDNLNGSTFTYDASSMNETATALQSNTITQAANPSSTPVNIVPWIPFSGKFTLATDSNKTVYEYEGIEALTYGGQSLIVKNTADYVDAKNQNAGLPPRWSGTGYLKQQYATPSVFNTSTATPTVSQPAPWTTLQIPETTILRSVSKGLIQNSRNYSYTLSQFNASDVDNVNAVIATMYINVYEPGSLALNLFCNSMGEGYRIGINYMLNPSGSLTPAPFAEYRYDKTRATRLDTVEIYPVNCFNRIMRDISSDEVVRMEAVAYIKNSQLFFDLIINNSLIATFAHKNYTPSVLDITDFGISSQGMINKIYNACAIDHPISLSRNQWMDSTRATPLPTSTSSNLTSVQFASEYSDYIFCGSPSFTIVMSDADIKSAINSGDIVQSYISAGAKVSIFTF